jgi:SAM-dependent MidA family methyltransferase
MTAAAELLRAEIARDGPISFARFMEVALYHPECGYYRRSDRDPFGKSGDFYTAAQLQPVFGRLIAAAVRRIAGELGNPEGFTVVDLGAGREEMAEHFRPWRYVAVDAGRGKLPEHFTGTVFANEFFDALPVEVVTRRNGRLYERRVDWNGSRFVWRDEVEAGDRVADYLARYAAPLEEGGLIEVNFEAQRAIHDVARSMAGGRLLVIDYGYTARETVRFQAGTLMSYRRHQAFEDVLDRPGEQDITSHVNFTALGAHTADAGLEVAPLESMPQFLLRAGEADSFAEALEAGNEVDALRLRMQLKTLLYGMGETFRVMAASK